jgi:DNA polymerase-1
MYKQPNIQNAYDLFHEGIIALQKVEQQGMRINVDYLHSQKISIDKKIQKYENFIYTSDFYKDWKRFYQNKPINIYSGQQLANYLYKEKGIKPKKTTASGQGSTDIDALSDLNIPEIKTLLEIKKLKKIRDTYLDGFLREQVNGVIHPFFNLHSVVSFRSSSNSPNFQNIPKRDEKAMKMVRKAIFPRVGHQLLEVDTSSAEFRIAGCYYKDPTMLKYIKDDIDIHGDIASKTFFIDHFDKKNGNNSYFRSAAKNGFVFPQLYGSWYKQCAINLACEWGELLQNEKWKSGQGKLINGVPLADHFKKHKITNIIDYQEHIKTVEDYLWNTVFITGKNWQTKFWGEYQKNGYFYSKTGFLYQGEMSFNNVLNYPIQGSAFHVLLWSLIKAVNTFEQKGMQTRIIGQVHDSIVLDVWPPELQKVITIMKQIMEIDVVRAWPWIIVPMKIEAELCPVDGSWAEKQEYKI